MIASDLLRVAECAVLNAFSRMSNGLNKQEIGKLHEHIRKVAFDVEQRQIERIK